VQHTGGFPAAWWPGLARLQHAAPSQLTASSIVRAQVSMATSSILLSTWALSDGDSSVCGVERHCRSARPITNGQGRVASQAATGPPRVVLVSTIAAVQPAGDDAVAGPWAGQVDVGDDDAAAGAQAAEYLVRDFAEKSDMVRTFLCLRVN